MATTVLGYNVSFKVGAKQFAGRTQEDLTISANTKESITKEDFGNKRSVVTGHEVTCKVAGIVKIGTETDFLTRDDIMEMALATGNEALISNFQYHCANGDTYTGAAVITGYSESSNSEDEATYTLDFKISGAFTKVGA